MKEQHQPIDDMTEINPYTGLPKHVYQLDHDECSNPAIRASFQMRGKKYYTSRYTFTNEEEKQAAIQTVLEEMHELKKSIGYYDYLENEGWRKKVRRIYQHESLYPKDRESDGASVETSGDQDSGRIRHVPPSDGLPGI